MFGTWHLSRCFSVIHARVPWNPFHTQQCRLRVDGVIVECLLWLILLVGLRGIGLWFWAGLWRWRKWPDVMFCSDLHEVLERLSHSCAIWKDWLDFFSWFCGKACVCLHVPVFPLWDVWRFDSHVPHLRAAQRLSICTAISNAYGNQVFFSANVWHVFCEFMYVRCYQCVCQKDLIREHTRWRDNSAPSQSDLEVLSARSTWDVWAFIFFVFPSNVDRESPISVFIVMSAVFVSFFDSDHYLFWNGRLV